MAKMTFRLEKSPPDILSYLGYFVFVHRVLLVVCAAVFVLNIWLFLRLKWWKMTKLRSKGAWWILTNTTWNCSNQWRNRRINQRQSTRRARRLVTSQPSSPSAYLTPAWDCQHTASHGSSDETLNEVTWAFDSSPSVYRSHVAVNECKCDKETTNKSTKPSRPEKKHHRSKNRTKDKRKVTVRQTENDRNPEVRKEIQRQTRAKSNSSLHRLNRAKIHSFIPRLRPINARQKTLTKLTPSPVNKETRSKIKNRYVTRIPVAQGWRQTETNEDGKATPKQPISSESNPSTDGLKGNLPRVESNLVCKKDSWIWFSRETRPSVENFTTRKMKFQSCDPRVAKLAEEIKRQELMNQDIERNARSMIESSSCSDPRGLTFITEKRPELAAGSISNVQKCQNQVRQDSNGTSCTNKTSNVQRGFQTPLNYRLQRHKNSRSQMIIDHTKENLDLTKESKGLTSDYFRNTGLVSTTLVSPVRFSKTSSPKHCFTQSSFSPSFSLKPKNVLENIRQNNDKMKIATVAQQNSTQKTGNKSFDERNEQASTPSMTTTQRRFWPRSMSANVSGQAFQGMHTFGNQSNQTNSSTLKLEMNVSPLPSEQKRAHLPRRCHELTSIPVSGKATPSCRVMSPSYVLSNGESETDSIRPRFVKSNNPRIESVIKREVNSIVSGLFMSPNQSSTSFTQPTPFMSATNADESTSETAGFQAYLSDLQRNNFDSNPEKDLDTKPTVSNSFIPIPEDHYIDDRSKLMSRIPVLRRASSATLEEPQNDLLGVSGSKMCDFSSSQNSIKRVNIYSPDYYLGKRIAKSCSQKECSTPSDKLQPLLNAPERQIVKELGLSPRRSTYTQHFVYNSKLQSQKQFKNEEVSNNLKSPVIDFLGTVDRFKKEHDFHQEEIKSTATTKITNQMSLSSIISNITHKKGHNPNSINFEPLSCYNDRTTYYSIGSNNSSSYHPSKRYISQNKERQFRGMPYDRLLHKCNLEKLRNSFPESDKMYVHPRQNFLKEINSCQGKERLQLDTWLVGLNKSENTEGENMHEKQLILTNEFSLNLGEIPVFDINMQADEIIKCNHLDSKLNHDSSTPTPTADGEELCSDHILVLDNDTNTLTKTNSPVVHNLVKDGELFPKINVDSGYETLSIDVNGSPDESALLTNAGVVSNLDTMDTESINLNPSGSPSECLSSPELAEINQLSIDNEDSAEETLPPSISDDNSLWSYDPCHVELTPEAEKDHVDLSDNKGISLLVSENQITPEKDNTKLYHAKEKKNDRESQESLATGLTIVTTLDTIHIDSQEIDERNMNKNEPLYRDTINSCSKEMCALPIHQTKEDSSLNMKQESLDQRCLNQTLSPTSSDENEKEYTLEKLKGKLFVYNKAGEELLKIPRTHRSSITRDTGKCNFDCMQKTKDKCKELFNKQNIVNASLQSNSYLETEKRDCESYSLGTSSSELSTDEDVRKNIFEVSSPIKTQNIYSEIGSKHSEYFSNDNAFHLSSMSRFQRSQELIQDKSQISVQKIAIIPKRGLPFSELLKRF